MRLLLDTHALAWWYLDDPHLPHRVRVLVEDPDNVVFASAISAYEAGYKHRLGKWPDVGPLLAAFDEIVEAQRLSLLPITGKHASLAASYNVDHGDPFDRILAAQAEIEDLVLATSDRWFGKFGTNVVW
ncbi:MAG TPA: type II toxin-antitoxin system VapC family toxin [Mesorhizobium sp.]|jgi:PIN domain nuclease of toxin-antitoxin system